MAARRGRTAPPRMRRCRAELSRLILTIQTRLLPLSAATSEAASRGLPLRSGTLGLTVVVTACWHAALEYSGGRIDVRGGCSQRCALEDASLKYLFIRMCAKTLYSLGKASIIFFFFQAEDGIRDVAVTGVQTCALPIVRFVVNPRLKRLKYPVSVRASTSADSSPATGEHSPIWGGVFARFKDPDGNAF